ncbi:pyrroloquinoline-quinone synthase PqqC [Streptomyces sp. ISL-44]|uniref:pyrroloquinoline-quinone synthase PqqC n=1 Tax=unclassified Streptomyces TaxID=2593676 RepID=UPI001BE63A41|nr:MULTISPECIES: pyrroloquinoline-quinone synthase PqqC [unclassified Streptomyces]MBT2543604.1 pyrroloquinoline-quinone synthase PqqC [Streptomyces sp. ISL-44]MCX5010960.1 pyrroloquinoline-quinone synthase PqqC [Streptomyces sp. NBC_00555]MCX5611450.1 pyrroloquinoline-quinone synthase PqqC [Streptomyces sp. NBC_00047]UUU39302.1 pyrroloquinoline-quinone synthase PqqC [Streptomyces sp. NBC_00162]
MTATLDESEFISALRALSSSYWGSHPFHRRLHGGELDRRALRLWAANRWYYQRMLPQKDAAIISNCPLPEIRRVWVDRLAYHDGTAGDEGGIARWLRLCEAVGLSREEVLDERHVVPGVRFAVDAYVNFARTKPWAEAVASGLTEMFAGHLMSRRVADMLAHYDWIRPADLAYFTDRIEAVSGEGKGTLDIVVRHCTTREQQDAAVAALRFKCDLLWLMLDAVERATATGE